MVTSYAGPSPGIEKESKEGTGRKRNKEIKSKVTRIS